MEMEKRKNGKEQRRRTRNIVVILCALLLIMVFAPGIRAQDVQNSQETNKDQQKTKETVFERIAKAASMVSTIASEFRQERHLSMLKEPSVATGRFSFQKPEKLRWEIMTPEPFGFFINGNVAKQWKGKGGIPEAFDLRDNPVLKLIVEQITAWTKADFKAIEKQYSITILRENPVTLRLTPRSSGERKYIRHIQISFETETLHPNRVEIAEQGGDVTIIQFFDMKINTTLDISLFQ